jgi:rhodanese-related sulfurtransferase
VPEELVSLLAESAPGAVLLVDVRSSDAVGGHIRGSVSLPFDTLESSGLQSLLGQIAQNKAIVFLCMTGRQRSPVAAEQFLAAFREAYGTDAEPPRTYVLVTGFTGVINHLTTIAADKSGQ